MKHRQFGFTLIEVLIVVLVLALLVVATRVAYNGIINRASNATAHSDLENFGVVLAAYKAKNGYYPGINCVNGTESCPIEDGGVGTKILDALVANPYEFRFSKDTYRDVTSVTPMRFFLAYTVDTSLSTADRTVTDICIALATSDGTYRYYSTVRGVLSYGEDNINMTSRQTTFGQSCASEGGMSNGTLSTQPVTLASYLQD